MTKAITTEYIWEILEEVMDPEIPVLSLVDLGVIRKVDQLEDSSWKITMTPTYTGCPAMNVMVLRTERRLEKEDIKAEVEIVLSPAWTTDWMTESGMKKLEEYGIAPPQKGEDRYALFGASPEVPCPKCKSTNTEMLSQFGSTACKSLFKCNDCEEPFEYFKCHR